MFSRIIITVVLILNCGVSHAQEVLSQKPRALINFNAHLGDGSLVNILLLDEKLKLKTKYGVLDIPFTDVLQIDFGLHYPEGLSKKITDSIRLLSSSAYREREDAMRQLLEAEHFAYPMVSVASKSNDLEFAQRVDKVLSRIKEKCSAELLSRKECDVVQTIGDTATGRLLGDGFRIYSKHFGERNLHFSEFRSIIFMGEANGQEVVMDAKEHGTIDKWVKTNFIVRKTMRLLVKAEGQVDLWPQGPGQYMTTPKGYTTAGKGSAFMAGTVLGKVGDDGKPFLIGERYDGKLSEEGPLYLQIVPAPWNNTSAGTYRVRINAEISLGR